MSKDDLNETEALGRDLIWILGLITHSGPEERQRIALAYNQAQELVASIPKDNGDARPRIVACFERSDAYKAADDVARAGWLLIGMQERVNERDLPDWRKLRKIIKNTVKMLTHQSQQFTERGSVVISTLIHAKGILQVTGNT